MNEDFLSEEWLSAFAETGPLGRREFLRLLGGGITIFFTVDQPLAEWQQRQGGSEYPQDFNAYLRIGENGRIACFTGKIEMGQGIITSLAQMLAEELEVPLASVDMVMGDTALCPFDGGTNGSRSTKYFGPPLRKAAAEAKAILLQLAAERWQAPTDRLVARDGVITDRNDPAKRLTYAELAKGQKIDRHLTGEIRIEPVSRHTLAGRPAARTDGRAKVTGEAKYSGDLRLPGMLYARVLRPPAHGATLRSVDVQEAAAMEGVQVVQEKEWVAVLHEQPDMAERALASLRAEWDIPQSKLDNQSIFEHLKKAARSGEAVVEKGDLAEGRKQAAKAFDCTYLNHYVAHVPMEPHTAIAQPGKEELRVWASTQSPFRLREDVAREVGLSAQRVRVMTPFVGGGYGGKSRNQQAVEAARLAMKLNRPVQIALTRKEEFFEDTFRPAAVVLGRSGLNGEGRIVFWDFEILFPGTRSSQPVYDIPHQRVFSRGAARGAPPAHPFLTGAWRGPGSNTNVFAIESQIDVMAAAAGMDPLTFRLKNLANERVKRVLERAAEKAGYVFAKGPSGKGYGIACTDYLGTCLATIAHLRVDEKSGKVRVERLVCAQDSGEIINPEGTRLQIEGCLMMGLGYALTEEIRFQGGRILDENFDTYRIPRFSWLPQIETVLVPNDELPPQGCGEPAVTTMGAVIANAIYDAAGVRMFELPMTPERIMAGGGELIRARM